MKDYNEIAHNVLERRDEYITRQKSKRKKITQITSAIGCFVLVAGISIGVNRHDLIGGQHIEPTKQGEGLYATTSPVSDITENLTTTVPLTETSAPTTEDITTTTDPNTQAFTTTTAPITHPITTTVPPEFYHEIDWNYKSLPGKFHAVVLEREEYNCFGEYVYPFRPVEEQASTRKATKIVSDKLIEQYTPDGKVHAVYADLFSLEGFSEELVIGVKFSGDDRIFPYINVFYQPETLGELLEAIDYDNTVSFGSMTLYRGTNFPVNDKNAKDIKDYLLSDSDSKNLWDLTVSDNYVTASIYCRELGIENKSFKISEDGYITTNIIGYQYVFYVGKEEVANFLKDSYNITFEQIKEIRSNATTTTHIPEAETTVSENAVVEVTTSWWCGTAM